MDAPLPSTELGCGVVIVFGAGSAGTTLSNEEAAARARGLRLGRIGG